jgi:hypothetical protein
MERTVPSTESEEVDLYLRTYYSLLRSTADVQIRTLEEVHAGMNSLLHQEARSQTSDIAALLYSLLRMPDCIIDTQLVVLGQTTETFEQAGLGPVHRWMEVSARARRRRCFYNGSDTLACLIASRSDIDDIIPILTAFQIEWNKLHQRLRRLPADVKIHDLTGDAGGWQKLAALLELAEEDLDRLYAVWDENFEERLEQIATAPRSLRVRLLSSSYSAYRRATHSWWNNIENRIPQISSRPLYFISSNTHSVLNLLTGFPLLQMDELVEYLHQPGNTGLMNEWNDIQVGRVQTSRENFLYYVYKKYLSTPAGKKMAKQQAAHEAELGIERVPSYKSFDIEAQVYPLGRLVTERFDPRLVGQDWDRRRKLLLSSDALIINIDYPLGLSAYNILSEVAETNGSVLGVYVIGKAATLNAVVGDVMIPSVVHDEHSQNTFLFSNALSASDVTPYLVYGTVLDNQKAVTVQGTFLQTHHYMDVFYREGYTDIEMEAGPYLSAVYEMFRPRRHPYNEIVNLHGVPFDLGVVHYASDTPLSKGKNLGAGSLSYWGMDATYAVTVSILRRILNLETNRLLKE